ncbi:MULTISPECIES: hypothetical protein [unclassified Streptomyces]|uniref:hypothetical protein n=1 Tax=unclassified Streptomyces TaxID=2593676 RepID=UPI00093F4532|nr:MULTISPECIES: hypothetical protein [unclassified Streptomyces]NEC04741.1 hypothetical protein [Streptomyces sp. SID7909]OKI94835.1 hypothetical protein AMK18_28605 [Streptomyces sp. CB01249]
MTENAYYASIPGLAGGTRQLQAISDYAVDMFNEFFHDVSATSDWPGKDDSYAKTMIPQEKKQREGAVDTGKALTEAIVGVGDGTLANLKSVLTTLGGNLDAIHESHIDNSNVSGGTHGGGRH